MMTKEEVAQVIAYCDENKISYKQRLSELGISPCSFYDAKRKYAPKEEGENAGEFLQLIPEGSFLPNPIKPSRPRMENIMEILELNDNLLTALHRQAAASERLRMNFDLRTTAEDGSQRMLNALEVGTKVPIHRHLETSETTVCLQGCLDVVFYDLRPNEDCGGPVMGDCGTVIAEGMAHNVFERCRVRLCPREGKYGVQIPLGAWHSVEVYESSTIFEAKDGAYRP